MEVDIYLCICNTVFLILLLKFVTKKGSLAATFELGHLGYNDMFIRLIHMGVGLCNLRKGVTY